MKKHQDLLRAMKHNQHLLAVSELREGRKHRGGAHQDKRREANRRACRRKFFVED